MVDKLLNTECEENPSNRLGASDEHMYAYVQT